MKKKKFDFGELILVLIVLAAGFWWGADYIIPGYAYRDAHKTIEDAGAAVKKDIMKHEKSSNIRFNSKDSHMFMESKLASDIWREVLVPTDRPNEGDYLVFYVTPEEVTNVRVDERDETYTFGFHYYPKYTVTEEQEKTFEKAAETLYNELALDGKSDYEKVRAIYNYICSNVTYDYDHLDDEDYLLQYTAYAALENGTAVCAGIAQLFYYMAKLAKLDVRIETNSTHAWNFVKVDGDYYFVDATWDLGLDESEYNYFLKGSGDFEKHAGNVSIDPFNKWHDLDKSSLKGEYHFAPYAYVQ